MTVLASCFLFLCRDLQHKLLFSLFLCFPLFFSPKKISSSSSSTFPLAQSELAEMSQPISCGIQKEQSHYWLMRRQGIKAFILITIMSVCKRAACTCCSLPPNLIFLFFLFPAGVRGRSVREGSQAADLDSER